MGWSKCDCSIDTSLVSQIDWVSRLKIVMVRKLNFLFISIQNISFFFWVLIFSHFIYLHFFGCVCAQSWIAGKTKMWQHKCQDKQRNIQTWIKMKGFGNDEKKKERFASLSMKNLQLKDLKNTQTISMRNICHRRSLFMDYTIYNCGSTC